ncbi:MAG: hypothetical protein R2875_12895 [Desulfobacterales bacterium]
MVRPVVVLGTGPDSPTTLLPVDADIGVITGNRSLNPGFFMADSR